MGVRASSPKVHRDSSNGFGCWARKLAWTDKFVLVTLQIKAFRIMAVKRKKG